MGENNTEMDEFICQNNTLFSSFSAGSSPPSRLTLTEASGSLISVVMNRKLLPKRPSFFKVLIKDYNFKLILPPVFVEEYRKYLPGRVDIRSNSGVNWKVKVKDIQEENICFTGEGWNQFAQDAKLRMGEFLVFWFDASKSRFDVKVYGTSCCEREISVNKGMSGEYIKQETAQTSFFKIIMNLEDNKLRIPKEFVQRSCIDLGNEVFLKVASESIWRVEVSFSNGHYWFDKGWIKFKRSFSIGLQYLLIFLQQGSSNFDVVIFDPSATKIECPFNVNNGYGEDIHLVSRMKKTASQSDDSVEFLGEVLASMKSEGKMKIQKQATERGRGIATEIRKKCESKRPKRRIMLDKKIRKFDKRGTKGFRKQSLETETRVADLVTSAYERAQSFISVKRPSGSFLVSPMRKLHILWIPKSFAWRNLPDKRNKLELRSNGKAWYMSCSIYKASALIHCGWNIFVKENSLQPGDACIFEVSTGLQLVWNVTIFRN